MKSTTTNGKKPSTSTTTTVNKNNKTPTPVKKPFSPTKIKSNSKTINTNEIKKFTNIGKKSLNKSQNEITNNDDVVNGSYNNTISSSKNNSSINKSPIKAAKTNKHSSVEKNGNLVESPKKMSVSKSTQNVNTMQNNLRTSSTLNVNSPTRKMNEGRVKSALNIMAKSGEMVRTNSLKPFPKVDPEFYCETKDLLWGKDLQRINTEKKILYRPQSEKRFKESDSLIFKSVCKKFIYLIE
jgi:hypothetical protein